MLSDYLYSDYSSFEYLELFTAEPVEALSPEQSLALKRMKEVVSKLTRDRRDLFQKQAGRKKVYWQDNQAVLPDDVDADLVAFQIVYPFWNRFNSTPERYEEVLARSGKLGSLLRLLKEQDSN